MELGRSNLTSDLTFQAPLTLGIQTVSPTSGLKTLIKGHPRSDRVRSGRPIIRLYGYDFLLVIDKCIRGRILHHFLMPFDRSNNVAINENSDPVQKSFPLGVAGDDSAGPNSIFLETFEIVRNDELESSYSG